MRTSASQFLLLLEFMERYGDLSKPTEGPQGRATNIQRWAKLSQLLNADATGDTKTAEKWRKVWSDLKNNTKKKAARIHRAAHGTGGGPASALKLGDLEQRVLTIVGTKAATGITDIPEIGLEEEVTELPNSPSIIQLHDEAETCSTVEDWNQPGTSAHPTLCLPSFVVDRSEPGPTSRGAMGASSPAPERIALPVMDRREAPLPLTGGRDRAPPSPTPLPLTPRRRRRGRLVQDPSSPIHRRTRTQTQSELARQSFVRSDIEWRAFQQETERERNRLRQVELGMQERWLDLFGQFLAFGNRIVDILDKKI